MPATKKRTTDKDEHVYKVTYTAGHQYGTSMNAVTSKDIRSSGWHSVDGLVTFYGSGPVFVLPERLLVSIELLG